MEAKVVTLEETASQTRACLASIEGRLGRIDGRHERNFRFTFGAVIVFGLGLAALMAEGFRWL